MLARSRVFGSIKRFNCRGIHSAGKNESSSVLKADESITLVKVFHKSAIGLAVLTPLAFALSSTPAIMPIDVSLALLFPIHSHVGLNYVVADYVPKSSRPLARGLVLVLSIVAAAGLLKLSITGPGLTKSVMSLWKKPQDKKA